MYNEKSQRNCRLIFSGSHACVELKKSDNLCCKQQKALVFETMSC